MINGHPEVLTDIASYAHWSILAIVDMFNAFNKILVVLVALSSFLLSMSYTRNKHSRTSILGKFEAILI